VHELRQSNDESSKHLLYHFEMLGEINVTPYAIFTQAPCLKVKINGDRLFALLEPYQANGAFPFVWDFVKSKCDIWTQTDLEVDHELGWDHLHVCLLHLHLSRVTHILPLNIP